MENIFIELAVNTRQIEAAEARLASIEARSGLLNIQGGPALSAATSPGAGLPWINQAAMNPQILSGPTAHNVRQSQGAAQWNMASMAVQQQQRFAALPPMQGLTPTAPSAHDLAAQANREWAKVERAYEIGEAETLLGTQTVIGGPAVAGINMPAKLARQSPLWGAASASWKMGRKLASKAVGGSGGLGAGGIVLTGLASYGDAIANAQEADEKLHIERSLDDIRREAARDMASGFATGYMGILELSGKAGIGLAALLSDTDARRAGQKGKQLDKFVRGAKKAGIRAFYDRDSVMRELDSIDTGRNYLEASEKWNTEFDKASARLGSQASEQAMEQARRMQGFGFDNSLYDLQSWIEPAIRDRLHKKLVDRFDEARPKNKPPRSN